MAYAPGDPNTPSSQRTAANGWNGSQYVGGATPPTSTAPTSPWPEKVPGSPTSTAPSQPRILEGFDPTKLADPTQGTTHKYVGGRILQSGGGIDQILADPKFAGWSKSGDDKIVSPEGSIYDTARDFSGANGQPGANVGQWTYVGGGPAGVRNDGIVGNDPNGGAALEAKRAARGSWGAGGGVDLLHDGIRGNAAGGSGSSSISSSSSSTTGGISGELYDMLMARAKQGTAIDRNDPNIRQQVDPYTAQVTRESRNYLADQAEKAGPNANMRGEARLAAEHAGQASGLFEGQMVGRELESRRAEITHALDSLRGQLSHDQELALQKELSYLENATRRYGIQNDRAVAEGQLGLGKDRLGLDYNEFDWQRDPANPNNLPRG